MTAQGWPKGPRAAYLLVLGVRSRTSAFPANTKASAGGAASGRDPGLAFSSSGGRPPSAEPVMAAAAPHGGRHPDTDSLVRFLLLPL